jgi:hypothetical protein
VIGEAEETKQTKWQAYAQRPFARLVGVFAGRVFHGGESADQEMGVALVVILILLAMPGALVSLLLFEKYGTLVRWMRGEGSFDPFTATIPDEYFFIVLSMAVTGAAVLWRWDALFLDRRDYANIVPLPVSLGRIFFGNLTAIFLLAGLVTLDVNAASFVLFPVVVTGSQSSLTLFLRFGFGHALTVILASVWTFFAIFAVAGLLLAVLPYAVFRRISLYARFLMALMFLALLVSGFAVPSFLAQLTQFDKRAVLALPPVWFVGICEALWGNGANPFYAGLANSGWLALGSTLLISIVCYSLSFRRSFVRIPETAAIGPVPRAQFRLFPKSFVDGVLLRDSPQRACFHFITHTLLRSEAHLQIAAAFAAMGLVLGAQSLISALEPHGHTALRGLALLRSPSEDVLSIPFVLVFFVILGMRIAFEVPSDLRANWVFAMWIDPVHLKTRAVARKILLTFSLAPLTLLCLISSWLLWGAETAILHTTVFAAWAWTLIEVVLVRFRKIPFTCTYPPFQSSSALTFVAGFFGFVFFAMYLPGMELWSLGDPWRIALFAPLLGVVLIGVHQYRKQMLDMDKHLIFEETPATNF